MFNKYQYQDAKKFLEKHNAIEINSVEFDTWKRIDYELDNGETWREYVSKLLSPEDDYTLEQAIK